MVRVVIKGIMQKISPVIVKDTKSFRRISIHCSGYKPDINKRITSDQVYDITVMNHNMHLINDIVPGDKVGALCFLNSLDRNNGTDHWHILSLNLKRIKKL